MLEVACSRALLFTEQGLISESLRAPWASSVDSPGAPDGGQVLAEVFTRVR
jgi:hypothetical protein